MDSGVQESPGKKQTEKEKLKLCFYLFFFLNIFTLCVSFWLCWVLVAVQAFLQLQRTGASHLAASLVAERRP